MALFSGDVEKYLSVGERIFTVVWNSKGDQDSWHWFLLIAITSIILVSVVIILIKSLCSLVEGLIKLADSYKSSGLPLWQNNGDKIKIRKRKQFCGVLDSDLSGLAKAENWNDQYFTDLEAEVETEGGYYASALDKIRRKKSFGLRKERSLMSAITSSTERAMQLVGEPGSGKSVALRHLAKQLSERGKKSNDKDAVVPLYINLREMEFINENEINVDSVKEFVLENIRRGDSDTSAFVKQNWQDYCDRGIWLFLFDSFDEIPAVLHAESGSNIVKSYSQALRQFLEGMGHCKGILASREFKGPEALPWKKLRVLPLSGEKQDELIGNSFLDEKNMNLVRQHLANSHSSIGATPLFLTLLCRYVRDENKPPENDHDILFQHIDRLSRREPQYLLKKYNLTPSQLVNGAERLARLFAEDENISLAPSLDQIRNRLPVEEIPGESLEKLISALVDSKIGRADVPNVSPGDRRFAFSHRRYQEALFVRYLTKYPDTISPMTLLTDNRWREYTVTLLQTRNYEDFNDLLSCASLIISERTALSEAKTYVYDNICNLGYYDWSDEIAVSLLSLLQEGLAHRLQDIPYSLNTSVQNFLKPRWENGDSWDRNQVLRLGGLLPHDLLVKYIVETFSSGTRSERINAFHQAGFTKKLPEEAKSVVLKMLSDQVIEAKNRSDLLSIEALASRLPTDIGAGIVVARCKRLRKNLNLIRKLIPSFLMIYQFYSVNRIIKSVFNYKGDFSLEKFLFDQRHKKLELNLAFLFYMVIIFWIMILINFTKNESIFSFACLIAISVVAITIFVMFLPYFFRYYGSDVRFRDLTVGLVSLVIKKSFLLGLLIFSFSSILFLVSCFALGYITIFFVRVYIPSVSLDQLPQGFYFYMIVGGAIFFVILQVIMIFKLLCASRKKKIVGKEHLLGLYAAKKNGASVFDILSSAEGYYQLCFWLSNDEGEFNDYHSIRLFSAFILNVLRCDGSGFASEQILPKCLSTNTEREKTGCNDFKIARQNIEDRIMNNF